MEIDAVTFDKIPMMAITRGADYVNLCCELGAATLLRLEKPVYDRLIEIGRIEIGRIEVMD